MSIRICDSCGRPTQHKRTYRVGTLIAVIFTGGLWLLALPAYDQRCVICGMSENDDPKVRRHQMMAQMILGIIWAIIAIILMYNYAERHHDHGWFERPTTQGYRK